MVTRSVALCCVQKFQAIGTGLAELNCLRRKPSGSSERPPSRQSLSRPKPISNLRHLGCEIASDVVQAENDCSGNEKAVDSLLDCGVDVACACGNPLDTVDELFYCLGTRR